MCVEGLNIRPHPMMYTNYVYMVSALSLDSQWLK